MKKGLIPNCSYPLLLLLIQPFLPPLISYAAVMGSGNKEIVRCSLDAGGGPGFSSGIYSVSYGLAQQAGVSRLESGYQSIDGGFYTAAGSGGRSAAGLAQGFSGRTVADVRIGIGTSQTIPLEFSKPMLTFTIASASRIVLIRDKDGIVKSSEAQVNYVFDESTMTISPATGNWDSNTTYLVEITTMALDEEGLPLVEPASIKFQTRLDPSVQNTIVSPSDNATSLFIAAGALTDPGYVEISSDSADFQTTVRTATSKFEKDRSFGRIHAVRELNFYDSSDRKTKVSFLRGQALFSIPYRDSDGDGIIDGSPPSARVRTTRLYSLDENSSLWVGLPGSRSDSAAKTVTSSLPHLSSFALGTSADNSVTEAYAYPSPFRPHGPNAGTGPGQTGTDSSGIKFVNLPLPATVEVFNLRGERIWKGGENTGAGVLVWDTKTSGGNKAASGIYIYLIRSNTETKTGKLGIIR